MRSLSVAKGAYGDQDVERASAGASAQHETRTSTSTNEALSVTTPALRNDDPPIMHRPEKEKRNFEITRMTIPSWCTYNYGSDDDSKNNSGLSGNGSGSEDSNWENGNFGFMVHFEPLGFAIAPVKVTACFLLGAIHAPAYKTLNSRAVHRVVRRVVGVGDPEVRLSIPNSYDRFSEESFVLSNEGAPDRARRVSAWWTVKGAGGIQRSNRQEEAAPL
ncbi:hypothetical protein THAOC_34885 [Thalassiosira oceanica]|uniref:Uncharacterized protein n=1 Tax=Thalassiosira oceanica TaxID=159749 RepID=K0RBH9_THAOC|nr:hypothetical protein THAOC_34885 [Thalassiosira oceanica]|eukprot:EJK46446.1 hypothetical protein THAOC_34885 [Thalassiosira oceanica]